MGFPTIMYTKTRPGKAEVQPFANGDNYQQKKAKQRP
jgi:hypothetical protein